MIKQSVDYIDSINSRLFDVFLTGPMRIYLSQFVKNKTLKLYLLLEGIFVILFNTHNYLHFDKKNSPFSIDFLIKYNHPIKGKPQLHRLYNLFVMYPIHIYIMATSNFTKIQLFLFLFVITVPGFTYNLYNYLNY